ncbi:MAG: hypothetical protein F6J96_26485 [Symploca sp. SIO1C2]|nr:hypothetical protein [Symploca sp. SIO1C2]
MKYSYTILGISVGSPINLLVLSKIKAIFENDFTRDVVRYTMRFHTLQ